MGLDADVGIEGGEARDRALELGSPDPARVVEDLPLQVALVDHVEVHDADASHARRGEVERGRGAESPRPHEQNARAREATLALDPHLGQDEVARVAGELLPAEVGRHRSAGW